MRDMFNGCTQLTSLDLSSFDTSLVTTMINMFTSCSSLKEIDISNFDISSVKTLSNMFNYCSKLEYINLNNSIEKSDVAINNDNMFLSMPINFVICID